MSGEINNNFFSTYFFLMSSVSEHSKIIFWALSVLLHIGHLFLKYTYSATNFIKVHLRVDIPGRDRATQETEPAEPRLANSCCISSVPRFNFHLTLIIIRVREPVKRKVSFSLTYNIPPRNQFHWKCALLLCNYRYLSAVLPVLGVFFLQCLEGHWSENKKSRHLFTVLMKLCKNGLRRSGKSCLTNVKIVTSSFSNLSVTSPTSQLILKPFRRFTYVTAHSPTLTLLHLRQSSFSNPSFASPTSQALDLIHLASAYI